MERALTTAILVVSLWAGLRPDMIAEMAATTLSLIGSLILLQTAKDSYAGAGIGSASYTRDASEQCTNQVMAQIWQEMPACKPREVLVPLPLPPDDADVIEVIPSHVAVPRCAGVCHVGNLYHHCVPGAGARRIERYQVMLRRLQDSQLECTTVEVEAHDHCKCGCDVDASNCTAKQVRFLILT